MNDPHEINPASSPVSGTSFPKIVEKQPFKQAPCDDCSTRVSHTSRPDHALKYSKQSKIVSANCSTGVSHRRHVYLRRIKGEDGSNPALGIPRSLSHRKAIAC